MDRPRIFLGSSVKQEKPLEALTAGLAGIAHVEPWTTVFNPGTNTLDRLVELAHEVDFAAFAFARDDWTIKGAASPAADSGEASSRDSVVFEAGLFGGALGMRAPPERRLRMRRRNEKSGTVSPAKSRADSAGRAPLVDEEPPPQLLRDGIQDGDRDQAVSFAPARARPRPEVPSACPQTISPAGRAAEASATRTIRNEGRGGASGSLPRPPGHARRRPEEGRDLAGALRRRRPRGGAAAPRPVPR